MPALTDLSDWMDSQMSPDIIWYVKRLSGNDTMANGTHQAGPYIPKKFLFSVFPSLDRTDIKNPYCWFDLYIDSHLNFSKVRAIFYNNKYHGNSKSGRNETRLTNFGGVSSPLLDPENTGTLAIFAFHLGRKSNAAKCHVWVCESEIEADLVEEHTGPVEPGDGIVWGYEKRASSFPLGPDSHKSCWLEAGEMPEEWLTGFPAPSEIIRKAVALRANLKASVDVRLLQRRACEFEIFRSVEQAIELPVVQRGFTSIDDFIKHAQTVLQRRKSRSGRSLELHAREIFIEENLREDEDFSHQEESEKNKKPDFIFPSQAAYQDRSFPAHRLKMLAVKTTCKDRWRQVLQEADRIQQKHLLTLQHGVSVNQFREMTESGVQLVVPAPLKDKYPSVIREHLQTFESFIGDVRHLRLG